MCAKGAVDTLADRAVAVQRLRESVVRAAFMMATRRMILYVCDWKRVSAAVAGERLYEGRNSLPPRARREEGELVGRK